MCREGAVSFVNAAGRLRVGAACLARLSAVLALFALPAGAQAQFTCATNGGTITISGYTGSSGDVVIPATFTGRAVTGIGNAAFNNCTTLISITIPGSVTSIGDNAFAGCTNLQTITVNPLNKSYSSVDGVLLNKSQTLLIQCPGGETGSYTVPGSVTSIGNYAFYECVGLSEIVIPSSVSTIGNYVFYGDLSLENVVIPDSVTTIGSGAFYGCAGLTAIAIPNSVTSIGAGAFSDCASLASFAFPSRIATIGTDMFSGCASLNNVTIPSTVTSIGGYAFLNCTGMTSITIPNSVTTIGYEAFCDCTALANVTLPNKITAIGNNVFSGCSNLNSVTIPLSVTRIGDYAFSGCTSLYNIIIPKNVSTIGSYAFSDCTGLVSFSATNSLTSIGDGAFSGCIGLTQITIPQKVLSLGNSVFSGCISLGSVTIPKSVTSIGSYAFSDCTGLTGITLSSRVRSIGDGAFSGCASLESITLPGSVKSLGNEVFSGCAGLATVKISSGLQAVGTGVFADCVSLTDVAIPGSVKSIGGYAFSGCTSLTGVTIPGSVTSLGNNLFSGCTSLAGVTIPNSVKSIGDYAFSGCSSLATVTLPAKITSTGNYTFLGCTNLSGITIPASVTGIGDYAFSGCSSLATVIIPASVTGIGTGSFLDCTSLTTIIIPGNIASVGYEAFSGCTALAGVFFMGDAPATVNSDVFLGADNAKVYYLPQTTGWSPSLSDSPTVPVTAPLIVQPPQDQYALIGSKATFSVSVFGPRPISYQWQLDGTNIPGAKSGTLTVSSVQNDDTGKYTVVAANSYGSITSSPALLSVPMMAGTYRGLITASDPFDNTNSGAFVITVTAGGAFSAKLTFPSQTTSASGQLAIESGQTGAATAQFTSQIGGRGVEVVLQLALDSSTAISGSFRAIGDATPLAQFEGAMVADTSNLGLFNVALLSATTNSPEGNGYGSIVVSTTGTMINLVLADQGAVITALASDRLKNGAIPVFAPLYLQKGFLSGWLTATNEQLVSKSPLAWHKEPGASTTFFTEGFNQWINLQGGVYTSVTNLAQWGTNTLVLDGQPLEGDLVDYESSTYSNGLLSIPVIDDQQVAATWAVTSATGLVKLSADGLTGTGILVPASAPSPGIYGFITNTVGGTGAVHSIESQPVSAP
jgi:hypothetical protein